MCWTKRNYLLRSSSFMAISTFRKVKTRFTGGEEDDPRPHVNQLVRPHRIARLRHGNASAELIIIRIPCIPLPLDMMLRLVFS
jgi:hypothetical protein